MSGVSLLFAFKAGALLVVGVILTLALIGVNLGAHYALEAAREEPDLPRLSRAVSIILPILLHLLSPGGLIGYVWSSMWWLGLLNTELQP